MKTLIVFFCLSLAISTSAQITIDNTFGNSIDYQAKVVNLSHSGKKYEIYKTQTSSITPDTLYYYNLDYSFWKRIVCPIIPGYEKGTFFSYTSETLFNLDTLLETARCYIKAPFTVDTGTIFIINENGALVDSILHVGFYTQDYFTVHNINATTFKATVTTINGLQILNLPGTLPCDICGGGLGLAKSEKKESYSLPAPVPNPSKNEVKLSFTLPANVNKGVIDIFNTTGQKIKSYTVDNRFGFIIIDNTQLEAGIYYYNLTVNGEISTTQKMLVIK